ncbi:MAG TPA: penicillin acylase family protein, partial [Streptosporangiaceae bacterium]|nr:penicillin acylase family protein [Streptosporangiaceae bacterium]
AGLARSLGHWTVADRSNPAFTPPGAHGGTAASAMRAAFARAVAGLTARFHGGPSTWRLGQAGASPVVSSAQVPVLGYGRRAAASSPWLVPDTAAAWTGSVQSSAAASAEAGVPAWRMIVSLGPGRDGVMAEGIYAGGQSDNPASPWFTNLTRLWQSGGYLLLPRAGISVAGAMRWEFLP